VHLGDTDIDQWLTLPVGYRATRFTAAPAASIKSSTPVPSSKTTPAAPAAPNPSSLEYTTNTQRIRHSTARKSNPSIASLLSASTPSFQQPSGSTLAVATLAVLRQRSSRTQHTSFYSTQHLTT